jgi:hypothetical protein
MNTTMIQPTPPAPQVPERHWAGLAFWLSDEQTEPLQVILAAADRRVNDTQEVQ